MDFDILNTIEAVLHTASNIFKEFSLRILIMLNIKCDIALYLYVNIQLYECSLRFYECCHSC